MTELRRKENRTVNRRPGEGFWEGWYPDVHGEVRAREQGWEEIAYLVRTLLYICEPYQLQAVQELYRAVVAAMRAAGDARAGVEALNDLERPESRPARRVRYRCADLFEALPNDSRRAFNSYEKQILFLRAQGCCQVCGAELGPNWHADHVHPHSAGGRTDVENGQALCERCNLVKGRRVPVETDG